MPRLTGIPPGAKRILDLARRDRTAARALLAEATLEEQVALVCETPASRRIELIDLAAEPERLIPLLPPADLCATIKAHGVEESDWLLEHAAEEQIVACLDLDAWTGSTPDRPSLETWLDVLTRAGDATLLRGFQALDAELFCLHLKDRVEVFVKENDPGWQPPPGAQTLDDQLYFRARRPDDDLSSVVSLLRLLFTEDYWSYFMALQGVLWELESDLEEWALRWRSGRMQDLGFPAREEAVAIYAHLPAGAMAQLGEPGSDPLDVRSWPMPAWTPSWSVVTDGGHSLFRAAAALSADERKAVFYAFVAVANQVAVADGLALGDSDSIPQAIEKTAEIASRGLEHLAEAHGLPHTDVLRRARVDRLFRVGANILGLKPKPWDEIDDGAPQ